MKSLKLHTFCFVTHIYICISFLGKKKMETLYKPNSKMAYSTFDIIHTIKTLYFCLPMGMSGLEKRKNWVALFFPLFYVMLISNGLLWWFKQ